MPALNTKVEKRLELLGNPPHHLLLGNDAYEAATAKLEDLRKEFFAREAVSRGADFPKE